uniref:Tetraspanin family protein n=1 Tax=Euplotes harpa TaxID=151035 RepID=A0A7S3JFY2_9SPIT|mmetsp:Transcript_37723/g.43349  ORF Transcript_37723/g.43349 Transcript_37723/m.43349 type:complete len:202 (+) Transcript_37723:347-952(+)
MAGGTKAADEFDKVCSSNNADNDFQKAVNELYTRADSFYCASLGCVCYATYVATGDRVYVTSPIKTSSTVVQVQECSTYLQNAYKNYGIDFSDINQIITYLNYFGEIESAYSCSGICTKKGIYYFSDCSTKQPTKKCQSAITEDILKGEIVPMGIGFFIIGFVMFVVFSIQYGLCCRKSHSSEDKYNESEYDNPQYSTDRV